MELIYSKNNIQKASKFIIECCNSSNYFFKGVVGAGKTTLIKGVCKEIQVVDNVTSPTFSIINEYRTFDRNNVYHMDLFRLKDEKEINELGIIEYFNNENIVIIEWPEILLNNFNLNHSIIKIIYINEMQRKLTINNIIL
jgi:tRNA threonylcarbamoyladenosine biosynthesis protein TsaE|tara:strand:+ start:9761 stop:10180 length:420 start_codon:yes stop_codon:yes gene_type:complete